MLKIAFAALTALAATSGVSAAIEHGIECTPCAGETNECVIVTKVNFYAGATGYYEFEGCEGVNPTLLLNPSRTYKFDQKDDSNWYHLLGFAYEADGAHVPVDELEPGIARGGNICDETASCPAPMYFKDGEYVGSYSNIADIKTPTTNDEDFGLDAVEPLFFHPFGDWQSYGVFETYLNYDFDLTQDFFYFCHIHSGMSGRVKLIDADGNKLSEEDTPALPYEYAVLDDFDEACGTFNLTDYQPSEENNMCPSMFICPSDGTELSQYAKCVEAMNCHMMSSMTTTAAGVLELFNHQMIPHHQNAVNMAKSFLKIHSPKCEGVSGIVEEGSVVPWQCEMIPIFLDIINVQNIQIIEMRGVLEELGSTEYANCDVDFSKVEISQNRGLEKTDRRLDSAFESGIDCKPCADTTTECEVIMKISHFAGERGYYTVDGCTGVNPTLHLSINRTYKFDQSDKSNWYHLIGFAYFADGAHAGVDELEPGIAPGDSDCAATLSCPAPMYFKKGEYTGVYSNNPDLLAATSGEEDFGLDTVEPEFFHPLGEWEDYGPYETYLNFDATYDEDIFYFCHVHSEMTGRIKLLDANGDMLSPVDQPKIPYEYDKVSEYDQKCGTFGLDSYQLPNAQCPEEFICDKKAGDGLVGTFGGCVDSMNCAMLDGMTTTYGGDNAGSDFINDAVLFMRMMIPHHQNAVNMAKSAMKLGGIECSATGLVEEGSDVGIGCVLDAIVRGIINSQNKQIQTMKDILTGTFAVAEFADCDVDGGEKKIDDDGKEGETDKGSDAHAIFGGTMAALAVGAAALL